MRKVYRTLALAAVAAFIPAVAHAQGVKPFHFGVQGDFETDGSNFGVGGRVEYGLATMVPSLTNFRVAGSFDYFFVGSGVTLWELNANALTDIPMSSSPLNLYIGAGLNYAHASVDLGGAFGTVSNSDVGLNVLGGLRFKNMGSMTPFVEARFELGGGENFIITGGLLF